MRTLWILVVWLAGCGGAARDLDDDASPADRCALEPSAFSPHGAVVQGTAANACVRLVRVDEASLDPVRRGTTWRAVELVAHVADRELALDEAALRYDNTHHNCEDVARAQDGSASLVIDGVDGGDASACFDPSSTAWELRLDIDGVITVLAPFDGA